MKVGTLKMECGDDEKFFYPKRTIILKVDIYENKLFSPKTQEGDDKKTTFLNKLERRIFFKTGRDYLKRGSAQSLTFFFFQFFLL